MLKGLVTQLLAESGRSVSAGDFGSAKTDLRHLISQGALSPEHYPIVGDLAAKLTVHAGSSDTVRRIAILGSYTTQPVATAVRCALLGEGIFAEIYEAPFGAFRQEILSPDSGLYRFNPDAVVVATRYTELSNYPFPSMPGKAVAEILDREVEQWRSLWNLLSTRLGKPVLQHLLEMPEEELLGVAERRAEWTGSRFVESLNARLVEAAPSFVRWLDVDRLAARVGRHNWHDPRLYYHGKLGFSLRFVPDYSLLIAAAWRSVTGRTKKALVVDLDNTLWGGVVGDDGVDGIRLGPGSAEGEAYAAFGEYLKALGRRGVILAVCSKNDHDTAAEVFEKHPHMPLRLDDFAAVQCNWEDKVTNLRRIAIDLNIDISSFVFVDDNPAECELVRQELPEVTVIGLDGDPAYFGRVLDRQHLFDSTALSSDDLRRSESYAGRAKAAQLHARAPDIQGYLRSLEMVATIVEPPGHGDVPRLAQMEMKTNQFNVTTRRLSQEEIEGLISNRDVIVLAFSLSDRFTDHGMVACLIAVMENGVLRITDWLMSCRVFSRTAEEFTFNRLLRLAQARGVSAIVGEYRATAKNAVVAGLYPKLGFSAMEGDSGRWWRLSMKSATQRETFINDAKDRAQDGSF